MTYNALDAVKKAAATSEDMNVAKGGGEYTPPAEGGCGLRFVSYIELGKQDGTYLGQPKVSEKVILVFEVSGPKYPVSENGEPVRIKIEMNKSLGDKAKFFQLFKEMNWENKAKIMAELLGEPFSGRIYHRTFKMANGKEGVAAELQNPKTKAFSITSPHVEDPETGDSKVRNVPPAKTPIKAFLWEYADLDMWKNIHIEGEYPERKDKDGKVTAPAKSKNVYQERIKAAKNFVGSPIHTALETGGALETVTATKTPEEVAAEQAAAKQARQAASAAAKAQKEAADAAAESDAGDATPPASEDDVDPLNAF